jgi:diguanylate cyclase (GGDEF)-like protein
MKHSIKKIFSNLSTFLFLLTFLSFLSIGLIIEQKYSFKKIENLNEQKETLASLMNFERRDPGLALIQFNGKSTKLHNEIENLKDLYLYDFCGQYVLGNQNEYMNDLQTLTQLTQTFNAMANKLYTNYADNAKIVDEQIKAQQEAYEAELNNAYVALTSHIDLILTKDVVYNQEKFDIVKNLNIALFVLLLLVTIWYVKRLSMINKDILFLFSVEKNKKDYEIFSEEVDAIALRMKRKPSATENPLMKDPLTQINNVKGLMTSYAEKKGMKESNFTSVTVFEVDNFSKSNRPFSQEFTQAVLKKIAFTLSLHEQATDVIARTDYNQFTVIFSRATKEQAYKDMDAIRQSISELKFKDTNKEDVQITITGGFIIKPNSTNLDESLRQSKEILQYAKNNKRNFIAQKRDVAEHDL